ncbi:MAG: hypothetical protein GY847_14315 [Proteobacteria bacterium]|nr:hypothetical protein [Pseudomonadota bacterium]
MNITLNIHDIENETELLEDFMNCLETKEQNERGDDRDHTRQVIEDLSNFNWTDEVKGELTTFIGFMAGFQSFRGDEFKDWGEVS